MERELVNHKHSFILIKFLLYIVVSSVITFSSVYLNNEGLDEVQISSFFLFLNFISLLMYILFPFFLILLNVNRIFLISLLIFNISLVLFLSSNIYIILLSLVLFFIARVISSNSSTLIIKNLVSKANFSDIQGIYFVVINLSWIISPIIFGFLIELYGMSILFASSILVLLICIFLYKIKFKNKILKSSNLKDENLDSFSISLKNLLKSHNFLLLYLVSLGPYIWFVLAYIYMPLFIVLNFDEVYYVGLYIGILNLINLLTSYYLTRFIQLFSIKGLFVGGYFLSVMGFLLMFYVSPFLVLIIFLIINIFIGILEPLNSIIYFKLFSQKESVFAFSIFHSSSEVGGLITLFLIGLLLSITNNFNIIFILTSFLFLILLLISLKIPLSYKDKSYSI